MLANASEGQNVLGLLCVFLTIFLDPYAIIKSVNDWDKAMNCMKKMNLANSTEAIVGYTF